MGGDLHRAGRGPLRPAVFLDRDGTLVPEREDLADPDKLFLLPGVAEGLKRLKAAGYLLVVVTNQSGIGRGLYGWKEYQAVARRLDELLAREGIRLDATYVCPHHPGVDGLCSCRKPGVGLFRQAAAELGVDLGRSWGVGDRLRDLLPVGELGGRGVLVRTGYGKEEEAASGGRFAVAEDFAEAVGWILEGPRQATPSSGGRPLP